MTVTVGSLCSGIGGLDVAVAAHYGASVGWFSEVDPAACTVLGARFPGVPNLGDVRHLDHAPPVDVVCTGFPCQPASHAGLRRGRDDDRWLWPAIVDAVRGMVPRPRRVVVENVPGLLTVDGGHAMADVLHGLAALGFHARWGVVGADDAGAPHRRHRVFVVADSERGERGWHAGGSRRAEVAEHGTHPRHGHGLGVHRCTVADPDGFGVHGSVVGPGRRVGSTDDGHPVADSDGAGWAGRHGVGERPHEPLVAAGRGDGVVADPDGGRWDGRASDAGRGPVGGAAAPGDRAATWGRYWPAVARWERIVGRPAPTPTDDRGRLNVLLPEWLMGFPEGWATDLLRRGAALRVVGNSVCAPQAALALALLDPLDVEVAA